MVYCVFSLESPHRGDTNEYTQYTIFKIKKENYPLLSQICSCGILFQGTQEQIRNRRGKQAISVWAIEVLLYCGSFVSILCCKLFLWIPDFLTVLYLKMEV